MKDLLDQCLHVIGSLNTHGVAYVVVGGVAMNLHGLVRGTEDLDFFVRADAENIDRLREALRAVWDDPHIDEISADDLCGDYPAVRYGPPTGDLYLDILTRLGEAFRYEDLEVVVVDADGVLVRVASPQTLHRMKRWTARAQDRADAEALRRSFVLDDEDEPCR
ncbi:MAG: nucleotidyl transferase AbiEii/AbiGii toxin family protein [Pseudomonadota bacterium]